MSDRQKPIKSKECRWITPIKDSYHGNHQIGRLHIDLLRELVSLRLNEEIELLRENPKVSTKTKPRLKVPNHIRRKEETRKTSTHCCTRTRSITGKLLPREASDALTTHPSIRIWYRAAVIIKFPLLDWIIPLRPMMFVAKLPMVVDRLYFRIWKQDCKPHLK